MNATKHPDLSPNSIIDLQKRYDEIGESNDKLVEKTKLQSAIIYELINKLDFFPMQQAFIEQAKEKMVNIDGYAEQAVFNEREVTRLMALLDKYKMAYSILKEARENAGNNHTDAKVLNSFEKGELIALIIKDTRFAREATRKAAEVLK